MQRPIDTSKRINQLLLRASKPHNTPGEMEKVSVGGGREEGGGREGGGSRDKQFGEEDLGQGEEEDHNDMKGGGLNEKKDDGSRGGSRASPLGSPHRVKAC